jgi:hypothetical protein
MLGIIGSLIGLIPGLTNLASAFITAHYNAQVALYQAKTGAAVEVARDAVGAMAKAQTQAVAWDVVIVRLGFGIPSAIWYGKSVLWDKVIMNGATKTDALGGDLQWAFLAAVSFYFLYTGAMDFIKTAK